MFSLHNFLKRENNIIVSLKQYVAVDPLNPPHPHIKYFQKYEGGLGGRIRR